MNRYEAGALAGLAATVPMTLVMLAVQKLTQDRQEEPLAPQEVTSHAADKADLPDVSRGILDTPAWLGPHFSMGASAGTLYGPVSERLPGPPAARGAAYGMLVWASNYLGLMPGLGLVKPPQKHTLRWNLAVVIAHLAWGASLGEIVGRLQTRPETGRAPHRAAGPHSTESESEPAAHS